MIIPRTVHADSYKAGHAFMYPDAVKMVAYGEFRGPFQRDPEDHRIVYYGMRDIIDNYLLLPWTEEEVEAAERFYSTHNAGNTKYPFPKYLFEKFIAENSGYFPIKVECLPEGFVGYPHLPVYQITCTNEYSRLVTFLETVFTHIWYPCTVATLSRKCKQVIDDKFIEADVPKELYWMKEYKLHDFGYRGTTCTEQAIRGGVAHLLNFKGTDTMPAAYYVQYHLNKGKPLGESIPATEHSVMLAHGKSGSTLDNGGRENERNAFVHMIKEFGEGVFAVVADTYDYHNTIFKIIPTVEKQGVMVIRPDSGEPKEAVIDALIAIEIILSQNVGFYENGHTKKGDITFLIFQGYSVIQGDGIDKNTMGDILDYVMDPNNRIDRIGKLNKGNAAPNAKYLPEHLISDQTAQLLLRKKGIAYSPVNCTFGMGAGLLQKVNRDTMRFATKLNLIELPDGTIRQTMKDPKTDPQKRSLPGELAVKLLDGKPTVFPKSEVSDSENLLVTVYDNGPVKNAFPDDFETVRNRVNEHWNALPKKHNAISSSLKQLQDKLSI